MNRPLRLFASSCAIAALLAASVPSTAQSGRGEQSTAAANAASARAAQEMQDAAAAARAAAAPPANETREQAKARKKAERARADAERAARPKSKRGSAIAHCALGAAAGILTSLLFGGRSAGQLIGAGAAGCIVGWGLGEALKGEDEKKLNGYIAQDYVERDDVAMTKWHAPESGQDLDVQMIGENYKPVEHTVSVSPDIAFSQANIRVSVRKMRTTAPIMLRSSADASSPGNIIGSFGANEIVQVYGDTNDLHWSYLADRGADGSFQLIGFVPTASLSSSLAIPAGPVHLAKPRPKPAPRAAAARGGRGAARKAPVAAIPMAAAPAPQRVTFTAATRCKNIRVSAGAKSGAREICGGSSNVA